MSCNVCANMKRLHNVERIPCIRYRNPEKHTLNHRSVNIINKTSGCLQCTFMLHICLS